MFRMIKAVIKKNRIITKRAYPWSFIISRVLGGIFTLLGPILLYYFVFDQKMSDEYSLFTGDSDYLRYIVIGEMINVLSFSTLMGVGRCLITEQREGTLEAILLSPMSRNAYYIGNYIEQFGRSLIEATVILLFGIIAGVRIPINTIPKFFIAVMISSIAFFSVSILVSSIMIYTRDTYLVQNTLYLVMTCVCGVAFPIEYFPPVIRAISKLFPLTYAIRITRNSLYSNGGKSEDYLMLTALCASYYIIGFFMFRIREKKLVEEVLS